MPRLSFEQCVRLSGMVLVLVSVPAWAMPHKPETADAALQACEKAYSQKDYDAAQKACQVGIKLSEGAKTLAALNLYDLQIHVLMAKKDYKTAELYSRNALDMAREREGSGSLRYAHSLVTQGQLLLSEGRFKEAQPVLTLAEERLRMHVSTGNAGYQQLYHWASYGLATAYAGQGNSMGAERAIRMYLLAKAYDDPSEYAVKMGLVSGFSLAGEVMYQLEEMQRAQPLFEEALRIYDDYKYRGVPTLDQNGRIIVAAPEGITAACAHLARLYEKQGKKKEAAELKDKAFQWMALGSP